MRTPNNVSVSVIIPTHNRPFSARIAVASALSQTISNLDVIVVDDCSDREYNVRDIIMSLNDDRITYIRHDTSMGPSFARNTGIDASKGDYIAFLDDDDIWMENKLEKQISNIGYCNASLCGYFSQYGMNVKNKYSELTVKEFIKYRDLAINSGLLVNSEIMDSVRFDKELRVGEDIDFVFKLLKKSKISYLREPCYFVNRGYHQRITTESNKDSFSLENRLLFVKKNIEIYGDFWGCYTIASLLLRQFKHEENKINKLFQVLKRCGLPATSLAIYSKILNRYT
jgi:glycosyltransferase involved in cell wall biosynthesis